MPSTGSFLERSLTKLRKVPYARHQYLPNPSPGPIPYLSIPYLLHGEWHLCPGNGQRDTLLVVLFLYQPGAEQVASFVHPSLMPGRVAKAAFCLGLRKKIKSNSSRAELEEEDRDLQTKSACHLQTCPPAHAIDTYLPHIMKHG